MWIAAGQGGRRRGGRRTRCGANDAAWDGGSNERRKCTDRLIRSRGAGALRRMIRQRVESERRVWERERERESACERKREEKEGRQRAHAAPLEERASNEPPLPSSHREFFPSALSALSVNPRLIQAPPPPPPPLASSSFLLNAAGGRHKYPRVGRTANLGFAFLIFVVYFNFLVLGKSWVESGQVQFAPFLLVLHGGALVMGLLWLTKRHNNWVLRWRPRARPAAAEGSAP